MSSGMVYDRMKGSLESLVRTWMDRTDYHALYACKVAGQNADGTLALIPDSKKFSGLDRIPLRLGVPGVTVKVAPGSRVLLGFENGSPSHPVATLWEVSSMTELHITSTAKVVVNAPEIDLGSETPSDSVVLGSRLASSFNTHTHLSASPGSPTGTPVVPMQSAAVSSSVVKAS